MTPQSDQVSRQRELVKAAEKALAFLTDERFGTWPYMEGVSIHEDRTEAADALRAALALPSETPEREQFADATRMVEYARGYEDGKRAAQPSETPEGHQIGRDGKESGAVGRRVVCAAIRATDGRLVLGIRHYSRDMHEQIAHRDDRLRFQHLHDPDQGFVDQFGIYMTREEAYPVALAAGQLWRPEACGEGLDGPKLYSEGLY